MDEGHGRVIHGQPQVQARILRSSPPLPGRGPWGSAGRPWSGIEADMAAHLEPLVVLLTPAEAPARTRSYVGSDLVMTPPMDRPTAGSTGVTDPLSS